MSTLPWLYSSILAGSMILAVLQSAGVTIFNNIASNNWILRKQGLQQLTENADLLKTPAAKTALLALLDKETNLVGDPESNEANKGGEEYAEYYGHLLDVVDSVVDSRDATAVAVLVRSIYNPDSRFALKLASYGESTVTPLLELSLSQTAHKRSIAAEMLGRVLRAQRLGASKQPLTNQSTRDIEQRLRSSLRDAESLVRKAAIRGAVAAGDLESISVLEQMRNTDPEVQTLPDGRIKYSVRESAAKAIMAIRARPLAHR